MPGTTHMLGRVQAEGTHWRPSAQVLSSSRPAALEGGRGVAAEGLSAVGPGELAVASPLPLQTSYLAMALEAMGLAMGRE